MSASRDESKDLKNVIGRTINIDDSDISPFFSDAESTDKEEDNGLKNVELKFTKECDSEPSPTTISNSQFSLFSFFNSFFACGPSNKTEIDTTYDDQKDVPTINRKIS